MAKVPLPQTKGRLSQSCDIFATTGGNVDITNTINSFLSTNDLQASSGMDPLAFIGAIAAQLGTSRQMGSIEKLEIAQTREVERIYGLGSYAYEPYRIVPKAVKTSLTLHKVVLYTEDFLSSVGFNSYNLYYQQAPFIIRQTLLNPNKPNEDPDVIFYFDCWVVGNPITFDLASNQNLVKQEIKVECGRMFVASAQFLAATFTKKLTRNGIKINPFNWKI